MAEQTSRTWQRTWLAGHRSGYLDAISVLWDMSNEAFQAHDGKRAELLLELATELKHRMARVVEREQTNVIAKEHA